MSGSSANNQTYINEALLTKLRHANEEKMLLLTEKQTRKAGHRRGGDKTGGEDVDVSAADANATTLAMTQGMYEEALEKNVKLGTLLMVWCMKMHINKMLAFAVSRWKLVTKVENVRVEMELKMKKLVEKLEMDKMMMNRQTDNPWFHTALSLLSLDKKRERSKSPHPLERSRSSNRGRQFNDGYGDNHSAASDNAARIPYQSRSMSPTAGRNRRTNVFHKPIHGSSTPVPVVPGMSPTAGRNRRTNVFHKPIHGSSTPDPVVPGGYSYYNDQNQQQGQGPNMYVASMLSPRENSEVRSNTSESSSRPGSPRYLDHTKNFEASRWHQYNQKHSPDFAVHGRHQNHPQTVRDYQNRLKLFHEHRKAISRLSRSASSSPQREFASTYNDLESVSAYSLPSSRRHSQLASYNEYGSNKYSDSRQLRGRSRYRSKERVQSSSYLHPTTSSMKKIATAKVSRKIRRQHDDEHDPDHSHFMGHTPMLKSIKRGAHIYLSGKSNQLTLSGKSKQKSQTTEINRDYEAPPVASNVSFQSTKQKTNGVISQKSHFMDATSSSRHHEPSQKMCAVVKAQHDGEYGNSSSPTSATAGDFHYNNNRMVSHKSHKSPKNNNTLVSHKSPEESHFMEATSSSRHHESSQKLRASVKAQHDKEYDFPTATAEPSAEEMLIRQRDLDNPERKGMVSTLTQISEEEIILEDDDGHSHNHEDLLSAHDKDLLSSLLNDPSALAATTTEASSAGTAESKELHQADVPNEEELFRAVSGDAAMAILEINSIIHTRDDGQSKAANGHNNEKDHNKKSSKNHLTAAQKKLLEGNLEEDTFNEGVTMWDHSLRKR